MSSVASRKCPHARAPLWDSKSFVFLVGAEFALYRNLPEENPPAGRLSATRAADQFMARLRFRRGSDAQILHPAH
jgi:hypothetical protein